jgi:hypothetical protein
MICPSCGAKMICEKGFYFCPELGCSYVRGRCPSMSKESSAVEIDSMIDEMESLVEEMEMALEKIKK